MSKRIATIGISADVVLVGLLIWIVQAKPPRASQHTTPPAAPPPVVPQPDALQQAIQEIVGRYRKTIVLLEDEESLAQAERDQASLVGKIIFQENHQALAGLSNDLTGDIENAGDFANPPPRVGRFLDLLETQDDLHDADKLSFREVLTDLAETL